MIRGSKKYLIITTLLASTILDVANTYAWTGTRMRKSRSVPVALGFDGSTLSTIRPGQKWQFNGVGGATPYTFSIIGGGAITTAGLYTASTSISGATTVRLTDALGVVVDTTVNNQVIQVTMTSGTLAIIGDPQFTIVDSGGTSGNYVTNESSGVLVRSNLINSPVNVVFQSFSTEGGYDFLRFYNGRSTGSTSLGIFSGGSLPSPIASSSDSMLIRWSSDGGVNSSGYYASLSVLPPSLSLVHVNRWVTDAGFNEAFIATGGIGPFTFSIDSGGGSISPESDDRFKATFTPPASGSAIIRVTDSVGNTYTENVTVGPRATLCSTSSSTSLTGVIYDPGGPAGNYSNAQNCGLVITPTSAGSGIQLDIDYLITESNFDYLYVYDGVDTSGALLGTFHGSHPLTNSLTATSGSMFLRFTSDGGLNLPGFRAVWKVLP